MHVIYEASEPGNQLTPDYTDLSFPFTPSSPDLRALYKRLARTPEAIIVGESTRDANGVVTSADVIWPDKTPGVFFTTHIGVLHTVDSFIITYGLNPIIDTYVLPLITRDSVGSIIFFPEIEVS